MKILTAKERAQVCQHVRPFGMADRLFAGLENYSFDLDSVQSYDERVKAEIAHGVADLRSLKHIEARAHLRAPSQRLNDLAVSSSDPVERDQAVWDLISQAGPGAIDTLLRTIEGAPTRELAVHGLLALHKVAHHDPAKVVGFLEEMSTHSDVERAEWARLSLLEMAASVPGGTPRLSDPISARDFVYDPSRLFDVTMPLIFHCDAYTTIGGATLHTVISPTWFAVIFGRAMACIQQKTFQTNLVLEKCVDGLHADGSPHYEHFPFSGVTDELTEGVHRHNYWAQLYRPYYTSGRTEVVTDEYPVIPAVAQSFCRVACTYTPQKYEVNGKPIPESVRGLFFGYGHVEPNVLVKRGLRLQAGDFQLSSRINPATGRPANTYFHGTFFGKIGDWDGDGKLDINLRPTHCDADGQLDYLGDGTMQDDPVRPGEWLTRKQVEAMAAVHA